MPGKKMFGSDKGYNSNQVEKGIREICDEAERFLSSAPAQHPRVLSEAAQMLCQVYLMYIQHCQLNSRFPQPEVATLLFSTSDQITKKLTEIVLNQLDDVAASNGVNEETPSLSENSSNAQFSSVAQQFNSPLHVGQQKKGTSPSDTPCSGFNFRKAM